MLLSLVASVIGLLPDASSVPRPAVGAVAVSRRTILGSSALAFTLSSSAPASADGLSAEFVGLPTFPEPRTDSAFAKQREALTDPFAATRAQDPTRGQRFADELPPPSAAERQRAQRAAAESIWSTENRARPAPQVSPKSAAPSISSPTLLPDDEFTLEFDSARPLGLKLKDLRVGFEYGTKEGTSRVLVSDVAPEGQAAATRRVAIDMIVVAVDGANVERESAKDVTQRLARAKAEGRPVAVTFKDALAFNERLGAVPADAEQAKAPIVTKIAPGGAGQAEQVLAIQRLEVPDRCTRNANSGDLVEIRYTGRLSDGTVFDGMELADRFGDDSLQFVLGRQPAGQFPPAWDVGLVGMCVGERRLIDVPPVLGFGAKGLPKRGVPPDARLLYDVELLAINALSTP